MSDVMAEIEGTKKDHQAAAKKKTAEKKATNRVPEPPLRDRLHDLHDHSMARANEVQKALQNLLSLVNGMLNSGGLSAEGSSTWQECVIENDATRLVTVVEDLDGVVRDTFADTLSDLAALRTALERLSMHVFGNPSTEG
jgi:hypothetical protein